MDKTLKQQIEILNKITEGLAQQMGQLNDNIVGLESRLNYYISKVDTDGEK